MDYEKMLEHTLEETEERKLPFVWELKKDGVISHAIGTQHALPINLANDAKRYLEGKTQLMLELDPDEVKTEDFKPLEKLMVAKALENPTPEQQQKFHEIFGIPYEKAQPLPIFALYQTYVQKAIRDCPYVMDSMIRAEAKKRNIPLISLETIDEQVQTMIGTTSSLIARLPEILQREDKYASVGKQSLKELTEAYLSGDIQRVKKTRLAFGGITFEEDARKNRDMVEGRNMIMAGRSYNHLSQPSLVAVGVAHLIIEPTMLALWEERGIRIERVQ